MSSPTLVTKFRSIEAKKLKDGSYPFVLQVTHKRKPYYIHLGLYAYKHEVKNDRYKRTVRNYEEKNQLLDEFEEKVENIYINHFLDKPFDYQEFKHLFQYQDEDSLVINFFDKVVQEIFDGKRKLSVGTAFHIRDTKGAILKYMDNTDTLTFKDIDRKWLKIFELNCLSGKCTAGGAASYMRQLKSMYRKAIEEDIIEQKYYPFKNAWNFKGYSFSHLKSRKKKDTLTKDELRLLRSHKSKDNLYQLAIDLYLFSYLCYGANVEDIARFQPSDIKNGDGYYFIQFQRKKTQNSSGKLVTIPLIDKSLKIIERYLNPEAKYIFPILKNHQEGDSEAIKKHIKNFEYSMNKRLQTSLSRSH